MRGAGNRVFVNTTVGAKTGDEIHFLSRRGNDDLVTCFPDGGKIGTGAAYASSESNSTSSRDAGRLPRFGNSPGPLPGLPVVTEGSGSRGTIQIVDPSRLIPRGPLFE